MILTYGELQRLNAEILSSSKVKAGRGFLTDLLDTACSTDARLNGPAIDVLTKVLQKHDANTKKELVNYFMSALQQPNAPNNTNSMSQFFTSLSAQDRHVELLRIWALIVALLGDSIHGMPTVTNQLLGVVQQCTKIPSAKVQAEVFASWKAFIENFRLHPYSWRYGLQQPQDTLQPVLDSERKKLKDAESRADVIGKLLIRCRVTDDEQAHIQRLAAWWLFVTCHEGRIDSFFDKLCLHLLTFAAGGAVRLQWFDTALRSDDDNFQTDPPCASPRLPAVIVGQNPIFESKPLKPAPQAAYVSRYLGQLLCHLVLTAEERQKVDKTVMVPCPIIDRPLKVPGITKLITVKQHGSLVLKCATLFVADAKLSQLDSRLTVFELLVKHLLKVLKEFTADTTFHITLWLCVSYLVVSFEDDAQAIATILEHNCLTSCLTEIPMKLTGQPDYTQSVSKCLMRLSRAILVHLDHKMEREPVRAMVGSNVLTLLFQIIKRVRSAVEQHHRYGTALLPCFRYICDNLHQRTCEMSVDNKTYLAEQIWPEMVAACRKYIKREQETIVLMNGHHGQQHPKKRSPTKPESCGPLPVFSVLVMPLYLTDNVKCAKDAAPLMRTFIQLYNECGKTCGVDGAQKLCSQFAKHILLKRSCDDVMRSPTLLVLSMMAKHVMSTVTAKDFSECKPVSGLTSSTDRDRATTTTAFTSLGNMQALLDLTTILLESVVSVYQYIDDADSLDCIRNVLNNAFAMVAVFFQRCQSSDVILMLCQYLLPPIARLCSEHFSKFVNLNVSNRRARAEAFTAIVKTLCEHVFNSVPLTVDILHLLEPLLTAGFKSDVSGPVYKDTALLWRNTFGSSKKHFDYSHTLCETITKARQRDPTLPVPTAMLASMSNSMLNTNIMSIVKEDQTANMATAAESQLEPEQYLNVPVVHGTPGRETKKDTACAELNKTTVTPTATTAVPATTPSGGKKRKLKTSLEDEPSSDFVPINASSKRSGRKIALTEHQKEKFGHKELPLLVQTDSSDSLSQTSAVVRNLPAEYCTESQMGFNDDGLLAASNSKKPAKSVKSKLSKSLSDQAQECDSPASSNESFELVASPPLRAEPSQSGTRASTRRRTSSSDATDAVGCRADKSDDVSCHNTDARAIATVCSSEKHNQQRHSSRSAKRKLKKTSSEESNSDMTKMKRRSMMSQSSEPGTEQEQVSKSRRTSVGTPLTPSNQQPQPTTDTDDVTAVKRAKRGRSRKGDDAVSTTTTPTRRLASFGSDGRFSPIEISAKLASHATDAVNLIRSRRSSQRHGEDSQADVAASAASVKLSDDETSQGAQKVERPSQPAPTGTKRRGRPPKKRSKSPDKPEKTDKTNEPIEATASVLTDTSVDSTLHIDTGSQNDKSSSSAVNDKQQSATKPLADKEPINFFDEILLTTPPVSAQATTSPPSSQIRASPSVKDDDKTPVSTATETNSTKTPVYYNAVTLPLPSGGESTSGSSNDAESTPIGNTPKGILKRRVDDSSAPSPVQSAAPMFGLVHKWSNHVFPAAETPSARVIRKRSSLLRASTDESEHTSTDNTEQSVDKKSSESPPLPPLVDDSPALNSSVKRVQFAPSPEKPSLNRTPHSSARRLTPSKKKISFDNQSDSTPTASDDHDKDADGLLDGEAPLESLEPERTPPASDFLRRLNPRTLRMVEQASRKSVTKSPSSNLALSTVVSEPTPELEGAVQSTEKQEEVAETADTAPEVETTHPAAAAINKVLSTLMDEHSEISDVSDTEEHKTDVVPPVVDKEPGSETSSNDDVLDEIKIPMEQATVESDESPHDSVEGNAIDDHIVQQPISTSVPSPVELKVAEKVDAESPEKRSDESDETEHSAKELGENQSTERTPEPELSGGSTSFVENKPDIMETVKTIVKENAIEKQSSKKENTASEQAAAQPSTSGTVEAASVSESTNFVEKIHEFETVLRELGVQFDSGETLERQREIFDGLIRVSGPIMSIIGRMHTREASANPK